jgi:hypothetical protein
MMCMNEICSRTRLASLHHEQLSRHMRERRCNRHVVAVALGRRAAHAGAYRGGCCLVFLGGRALDSWEPVLVLRQQVLPAMPECGHLKTGWLCLSEPMNT